MTGPRWKHYLPALGSIGLGMLFLAFPRLAALLLAVGLFFAGGVYAFIVRKMHQTFDSMDAHTYGTSGMGQEPNFRNVSVYMGRNIGVIKDVTPE